MGIGPIPWPRGGRAIEPDTLSDTMLLEAQ
jgi:hypothetical protein